MNELDVSELFRKSNERANKEIEYLYLLVSQIQRVIMKFVLVGLVQNAANANVQISLFAISIVTDGNEFQPFNKWWKCIPIGLNPKQWPMFFNIVMCLVGTILGVGEIVNLYQLFRKFAEFAPDVKDLRGFRFCRRFILLVLNSHFLSCGSMRSPIQRLQKRIWRLCFRFIVYLSLFSGVTWWSLRKLVAMYHCPDRLWNFWSGCVKL
mmetsp:Transcript_13275/g.22864  ORF Transcript_13275/g.22864 Transcript_13275/m.22864 type:complete len:208 (+) Transcript_13275:3-626(+)